MNRRLMAMMGRAFTKDPEDTAQRRFASLPGLQDIAVPVALWHADADIDSPLAAATYLSRGIPNASLTVLPEKGHFFLLKRWGEIIRQLTTAPGR